MAQTDPSTRTVLEPLATFDLSTTTTRAAAAAASHSLSSTIRSLATSSVSDSQTLIYIGTNSGSLHLLSTETLNGTDLSTKTLSFLRSVSVGDAPVETLILLTEIQKVIALCDGFLFLVDSLLAQVPKRIAIARGVFAIARRVLSYESEYSDVAGISAGNLESSSASQRLLMKLGGGIRGNGVRVRDQANGGEGNYVFVVVVSKKMILIELIDNVSCNFVVLKEMAGVDGVKTVVWLNDSIIVGTVNGYSLFSCVTGQSSVIFTLPDVSRLPFLKLLWREKKVMLLVDNVGVVVDVNGQPVGGSLVFRQAPESIGELAMYVVVVRDGKMELYHKKSGSCVQAVVFGGEAVGPCLVADEEGGSGKVIVVATLRKVICYRRIPSEEQIKDLLRKKNFKEAISLVEELECEGEMSGQMLSFVHAQVGFLLLFDLHFKEAVDHFLQSKTMQPSEVFPFIMRDPNRWSLLV